MFKFFKKKNAQSPVNYIDVAGYGSAKIILKPKAPSNMKISSDGYVSVPAPTENSYLSPYTSTDPYAMPSSSSVPAPAADDMNFLGAMANASSALDAPAQSTPYSSASSSPQSSSYPSSSYPSSQTMDDDKIYKILRKLDFLTEKLDLMEMKLSRIEIKTGVIEDK